MIVKGAARSAPVSNLLAQAMSTAVVARRPSRGAAPARAVLERFRCAATGRTAGAAVPAPLGLGRGRVPAGRRRHRAGRGDGRTRQPGGTAAAGLSAGRASSGPSWRGAASPSRKHAHWRPAVPGRRRGPTAGGDQSTQLHALLSHPGSQLGEPAIGPADAAAGPVVDASAGGDSRDGKVSYPGCGAALWVLPRVQGAGRRVAEVGARLAPAGGWRMELEFEIGSLPSASPMSRPAASRSSDWRTLAPSASLLNGARSAGEERP